jgi:hypothetical protein
MEILQTIGWEMLVPSAILLLGLIGTLLRKKGLAKAAQFLEAMSPVIVDAIERAKNKQLVSGPVAKGNAILAARAAMPLAVKALSAGALDKMASDHIESAYKDVKVGNKRIKELGISATTDGKRLGAEVKARFKRGELTASGSGGKGGPMARIGAKFRF